MAPIEHPPHPPPRLGPLDWSELRYRLDENLPFNQMRGTPYYQDAVHEHFSRAEVARRYAALRARMRQSGLDCAIVPGGPRHWSFGGGRLWLTVPWERQRVARYAGVPLRGGA